MFGLGLQSLLNWGTLHFLYAGNRVVLTLLEHWVGLRRHGGL